MWTTLHHLSTTLAILPHRPTQYKLWVGCIPTGAVAERQLAAHFCLVIAVPYMHKNMYTLQHESQTVFTVMYFVTKVGFEDSKRRELVNVQIVAFCSHQSAVHSTDLQPQKHRHNDINNKASRLSLVMKKKICTDSKDCCEGAHPKLSRRG